MSDNEDACGQGNATLWLAAVVGTVLGAGVVLGRALFYPYTVYRRR